MAGFFLVTDLPARRVVQYKRVSHSGEGVTYVSDEGILGDPINEMPYADKTGLAVTSSYFGMVYEVPYLPDAGDVYFAVQPQDTELKDGSAKLTVSVKAGKAPYSHQWYKDGQPVVNVPAVDGELTVTQAGKYFVKVTDADGVEAVSKEATVE
ncbi:putative tail protein [Salmonella phage pink]|uniref:Putative tail protein n=1 Tax=Salmonella phage pink TaxID=2713312 RepID=A0A6G8R989_9CAUD|nr:putative tail protein [Salmonella phage pink]QIN97980.1 putative tail protein [Salmonella phage pink]